MHDDAKPKQPTDAPEANSENSRTADLYDSFIQKSHEIFEQGQEKGAEAWEKSMEIAREKMIAAGEFSAEQGEAFKQYLRRDLENTMTDMHKLGKEVKHDVNPARIGAGALSALAKLLHASGSALIKLSERTEASLSYQTGEITMASTITCSACGHKIHLKKTSVVPACPSCQGTSFRKGY